MTYYLVRWKHPDGRWITSTMGDRVDLAYAKEQLKRDIDYFYTDIEIELVAITEEVVSTHKGSQPRP
jgi:hypothetical protein